jgi:archaellum component FlaF (FlaF/FlaG flagellin family)
MTNQQTITKFVNGATTGNNSNRSLFIEGDTIYSYGYHFPLARRNSDGTFWVNPNKYSVTTSKQQNMVRHTITRNGSKFSV